MGRLTTPGEDVGVGIIEMAARQMSAWEHPAPVVEVSHHRGATPRPRAKQSGREPDTDPKMLYPGGLLVRRGVEGVVVNTMVAAIC